MMRRLNKTLTADILLAVLVLAIFPMLWALSILKPAVTQAETSLPETNKALIQYAFEEVFNEGHLAAADEIFAPNFQDHIPHLAAATLYRSAFFNLRYTIEEMVAEGDKVVIRWRASGLHQDAFAPPYAPSGRQVTWTGMTIYRITNGQIVEAWTYQDDLNLIKQLGATLTGATWGPAYYADDTHVEVGRNWPELEVVKQVDQVTLTGKTWGLPNTANRL